MYRKRLGVTLDGFSQKTGLSRNAVSRAGRDAIRKINPRVLQQFTNCWNTHSIIEHLAEFKVVRNVRFRRPRRKNISPG